MKDNICQKEMITEPSKTFGRKMQNISVTSTINIKKPNSGGKGTLQERNENFLKKANETHGNKYEYSNSIYLGRHSKLEIICKQHGSFWQCAGNHLRGCGCPQCASFIEGRKRALSTVDFIKKSKAIHKNQYGYSNVNYFNSFVPVKILCKIHGIFEQMPPDHMRGVGCPMCFGTPKKTTAQFINDARKIFGNKYNYSKVTYNHNKKEVVIICSKHGEFNQKPNSHLDGKGCPKCRTSRGENFIISFLENNDIKFKHQQTFDGCRNPKTGYMLRFDFYLPKQNIIIEYDGKQHFSGSGYVGSHKITTKEFDDLKYKDRLKNNYASKNHIKLLRIKYTKFNMIAEILKRKLLT